MNKREMFCQLIKGKLWEKLSPEEIRLYLLLIIISDREENKGRISLGEINNCLGIKFTWDRLKKAISNLQKYHLVRTSSLEDYDFQFKL